MLSITHSMANDEEKRYSGGAEPCSEWAAWQLCRVEAAGSRAIQGRIYVVLCLVRVGAVVLATSSNAGRHRADEGFCSGEDRNNG